MFSILEPAVIKLINAFSQALLGAIKLLHCFESGVILVCSFIHSRYNLL